MPPLFYTVGFLACFIYNNKQESFGEKEQHIKQLIGYRRIDENDLLEKLKSHNISNKTMSNIIKLYDSLGDNIVFSRKDVCKILNITERPATTLLSKIYETGITEKVKGAGKGKYRFIV